MRQTDALPLSDQSNNDDWQRLQSHSDEFDGDALDVSKWSPTDSWNGMKPSFFSSENVSVSEGCLKIMCQLRDPPTRLASAGYGRWSTGIVKSLTTVLYGYFEVRAKPMRSSALSSFWFYKKYDHEQEEIDVFEFCKNKQGLVNNYHMTLHVYQLPGFTSDQISESFWLAPFDFADDFHVFGLNWTPKVIEFFVDGILVRSTENRLWHRPMHMVFDSEVHQKGCGIPDEASMPSTYQIDYVRSWRSGRAD
ncbi:beta-glucanase (GH16 family) [Bradyrhizobium sp. GM6.1]